MTRAIHEKHTYKEYIGVDACAVNLMRPAMYGAYHHITVMGKENAPCDHKYDVTGSLCENNDKFAVDRTPQDPDGRSPVHPRPEPTAFPWGIIIMESLGAQSFFTGGRKRPHDPPRGDTKGLLCNL